MQVNVEMVDNKDQSVAVVLMDHQERMVHADPTEMMVMMAVLDLLAHQDPLDHLVYWVAEDAWV